MFLALTFILANNTKRNTGKIKNKTGFGKKKIKQFS